MPAFSQLTDEQRRDLAEFLHQQIEDVANRGAYHLQNIALLPWYTGTAEGLGSAYSFPDAQALPEAAGIGAS